MKRPLQILTLAALPLFASCVHHHQTAPSLSAPPAASAPVAPADPQPEQKGFFSRTADATWDVVSAPAKLISPAKPAPAKQPETFDAPNTIIMTPMQDDAPAATQP